MTPCLRPIQSPKIGEGWPFFLEPKWPTATLSEVATLVTLNINVFHNILFGEFPIIRNFLQRSGWSCEVWHGDARMAYIQTGSRIEMYCNKQFPFILCLFIWFQVLLFMEQPVCCLRINTGYFWHLAASTKTRNQNRFYRELVAQPGCPKTVFESLHYSLFGIDSVQSLFGFLVNAKVRCSSFLQVCISSEKTKRLHSLLKNCEAWAWRVHGF